MTYRSISIVLSLLISGIVHAQSFRVPSVSEGRAGQWDFTFQLQTNASETYLGEQGTGLELRQRTGIGFGGAYNFTDHLALGIDLNFSSPRYKATIQPQQPGEPATTFENRADIVTGQLKGTWNLFKSRFTPYVEAGAGATFVDSNVVDTDVPALCWWDPWYGPICTRSSYSDTNWSYGGAVGLRWETKNNLLLKLSVNTLVIDTYKDPQINSLRFEIGAKY